MLIDSVKNYLKSPVMTPHFLFISDSQYISVMDELLVLGFDFIQTSSFCMSDDKLPDIDGLLTYIQTVDENKKRNKFVVTGLGEYLALRGNQEALNTLLRLKDLDLGGVKVVLLLRGLATQIKTLQTDIRFDDRKLTIVEKGECNLEFTIYPPSIESSALPGFKSMLSALEKGKGGCIVVNTVVNLDNSIFTVHHINDAYEGVKYIVKDFILARSSGSDALWIELLRELNQSKGSLDRVFENHNLTVNIESDFYARITCSDYGNWLYFIFLKTNADKIQNAYLRFVLKQTNCFSEFVSNILNAIIEIPHTDKRFSSFYRERKALVRMFAESEMAVFVVNNRQVVSESIYKLTDGSRPEREEIIAWISQNGLISQLNDIYPVLAAYLNKYVFKCPELADSLTDYFESYKRQKISNILEVDFLDKVDELARTRKFNNLPTRNQIIDGIDKSETFMYLLDALGVEYLALIEDLVQKRNLSICVNIARAYLPTITSINRGFFDDWDGPKEKNDELDETKHGDGGGYNYTKNEMPIHLAKELDIIVGMIDKAATMLKQEHCKRFLIVSDHGASRLAVLRRKEEQYETDTKGEHSGRCCKVFQSHDLQFAAEENGYLVLADYGRFKGSRAANVEVHGGASLEEVIVPIIELTLKDKKIFVKLKEEFVIVDYNKGAEISLYINAQLNKVSIVMDGKSYPHSSYDRNYYKIPMPDLKRSGTYDAEVYSVDDLIGRIKIKARAKSAHDNNDFDDLF